MSEQIMEATAKNWKKEVIEHSGLVVVDFWAPWCGPCKMIAPIMEALSVEFSNTVKIMKLNTDDNNSIASQYKIMGIPTLLFFKDGEEKDRVVGVIPKNQIKSRIEALL